jgi:hypothetical protein
MCPGGGGAEKSRQFYLSFGTGLRMPCKGVCNRHRRYAGPEPADRGKRKQHNNECHQKFPSDQRPACSFSNDL